MSPRIEDYAIIGDTHTAALVSSEGSIDWLCVPRFDSAACFAALLGDASNGRWVISPSIPVKATRRSYRPGTLVLETEMDTDAGTIRLVDCMPPREQYPEVVRVVQGVTGNVPMHMELVIRFDYGSNIPWVSSSGGGTLRAIAGPDALSIWSDVEMRGENMSTVADFAVSAGQQLPFELAWYPSHEDAPRPVSARFILDDTEHWWRDWSDACTYEGPWREAVVRSLITLKALTYAPTGGIVAAPTTSLPEQLGGARNWDYRYCWLRDATFTLLSLMGAGYTEEARAWREWLVRTVAGSPSEIQIMYGPAGERRLDEWEVPWLPGYEQSKPVRVGNAAAEQYQLDVYGEVMDALHQSRVAGIMNSRSAPGSVWSVQKALMSFLESGWKQPDDGIWEVRGPRRHFTHSKVMAWAAVDRAVQGVEQFGLEGPVDQWRAMREEIHKEVCDKGWNAEKGAFTQYYGTDELDASLLMVPLVGFLPANDPRVSSTVRAIESELLHDGLVLRYRTRDDAAVDGLVGREGCFLACSFWLVDNYALLGRDADARKLFEHLLSLRNDLGLLAEEYDPIAGRQVGNFPQAFSHVSLVNSAYNLSSAEGPVRKRTRRRHPATPTQA